MLQVAQFVQKQTTRVLVVGADSVAGSTSGSAAVPAASSGRDAGSGRRRRSGLVRKTAVRRRFAAVASCSNCTLACRDDGRQGIGRRTSRGVRPGAVGGVRGGIVLPARFLRSTRRLPQGDSRRAEASGTRPSRPLLAGETPRSADAAARSPQSRNPSQYGQRQVADRLRPALRSARPLDAADQRRQPADQRRVGVGDAAVLGGLVRRGRRQVPQRRDVVENPAHLDAALGADRRLLSGRRSLRRREGTRHAGNAAEQPRRTQRNRAGQAVDGHALQHRHRRVESGEHGHHGRDGVGRTCPASGCRR